MIGINWYKIKMKQLNIDEYNLKVIELQNSGLPKVKKMKCDILSMHYSYSILSLPNYKEIKIYNEEGLFRFGCYPGKGTQKVKITGRKGFLALDRRFEYKFGKSITDAFSGIEYKDFYVAINKCIPAPVNFCSEISSGKIIDGCWGADISSAYPFHLSKSMPTLHGSKFLPGRVEPTEEYPFAFYIKSHHFKVLYEFDTRDFKNEFTFYPNFFDKLSKWIHYENISDEEEQTILCKKSIYSFKEIVEKLYKGRNKHPIYKDYLNVSTGYFAISTNPILAHLLAVIRGRQVKYMLDLAHSLVNENNIPILIATDAIMWKGKESAFATDIKSLGAFVYKEKNCKIALKGVRSYQILRENGEMHTVLSGQKTEEEKEKMIFGDIFNEKGVELSHYVMENDLIKKL